MAAIAAEAIGPQLARARAGGWAWERGWRGTGRPRGAGDAALGAEAVGQSADEEELAGCFSNLAVDSFPMGEKAGRV